MTERKRVKNEGFVGLQLTPELLKKLDAKVKETTLNRSQVIRMAIIEYLKQTRARAQQCWQGNQKDKSTVAGENPGSLGCVATSTIRSSANQKELTATYSVFQAVRHRGKIG